MNNYSEKVAERIAESGAAAISANAKEDKLNLAYACDRYLYRAVSYSALALAAQ